MQENQLLSSEQEQSIFKSSLDHNESSVIVGDVQCLPDIGATPGIVSCTDDKDPEQGFYRCSIKNSETMSHVPHIYQDKSRKNAMQDDNLERHGKGSVGVLKSVMNNDESSVMVSDVRCLPDIGPTPKIISIDDNGTKLCTDQCSPIIISGHKSQHLKTTSKAFSDQKNLREKRSSLSPFRECNTDAFNFRHQVAVVNRDDCKLKVIVNKSSILMDNTEILGIYWNEEEQSKVEHNNHVYKGIDFSDSFVNKCRLRYTFEKDMVVSCVRTATFGHRLFWVIDDSNDLTCIPIAHRLKMPKHGKCTFIQSSCLVGFNQCCHGSIFCFKVKKSSSWNFGIVSSIRYKEIRELDRIDFYKWIGSLSSFGNPSMFSLSHWNSLKKHLEYDSLYLDTIDMFFVNQVRGGVPLGGIIKPGTRNISDGGVQCCKTGPDKWPIPKPKFTAGKGNIKLLSKYSITDESICCTNLLVLNNTLRNPRKRSAVKSRIPKQEHPDIHSFNSPPKYVPQNDQHGLVMIVKDSHGDDISSQFSSIIPPHMKGTFNVGSIKCANNMDDNTQLFFCLKPSDYDLMQSQFPDGMHLGEHGEDEIDKVLRFYACSTQRLLSSDKVSQSMYTKNTKYHGYVRLFAGDGCPRLNSTFHLSTDVPGFQIYYKMVGAREFSEYVPLSVGFFQSTFHGIEIPYTFLSLINRVSGKNGTFPSRARMNHYGHLSYLGKRKATSQSLPSSSEGPKESGYHYHRASSKHEYWPFLLLLMNFLAGVTSIAPFYFFRHLSKLYSYSNDIFHRIKFCDIIILTIDFCCTCHCDMNDKKKWCFDDMIRRLRVIIQNKHIVKLRRAEAIASLKHILWWGVSTPTTCCYQYIFGDPKMKDEIEIYQWFMCPGIGSTHRIRSFWVHIMLAGLFSHCTSSPIYIVNGKAYFGKCPKVNMFAWGTG